MKYLLWLLLLPSISSAAVLVRTQAHGYQLPANADVVQVLRSPASVWVPLATVLPTERIQVCYDDPLTPVGATTSCTTRVPGRTDNWELKSTVYPALVLGSVSFAWDAVTLDTTGAPIVLAGYTLAVRRQECVLGTDAGCVVAGSDSIDIGNVLTYTVTNVKGQACVYVQARTPAGDRGLLPAEVCGSPRAAPPVPAVVTGLRVVP